MNHNASDSIRWDSRVFKDIAIFTASALFFYSTALVTHCNNGSEAWHQKSVCRTHCFIQCDERLLYFTPLCCSYGIKGWSCPFLESFLTWLLLQHGRWSWQRWWMADVSVCPVLYFVHPNPKILQRLMASSVLFLPCWCGNDFSWHIKGKRRFIALSTRNGKQKDHILNLLLLPEVMQAVVVLGES